MLPAKYSTPPMGVQSPKTSPVKQTAATSCTIFNGTPKASMSAQSFLLLFLSTRRWHGWASCLRFLDGINAVWAKDLHTQIHVHTGPITWCHTWACCMEKQMLFLCWYACFTCKNKMRATCLCVVACFFVLPWLRPATWTTQGWWCPRRTWWCPATWTTWWCPRRTWSKSTCYSNNASILMFTISSVAWSYFKHEFTHDHIFFFSGLPTVHVSHMLPPMQRVYWLPLLLKPLLLLLLPLLLPLLLLLHLVAPL